MIKTFLIGFSFLIGTIILLVVIFIVGVEKITAVLSRFSLWGIIPLIGFTALTNLVSAVKWQYVLRTLGCKVALWPLFKAWLVGFGASYVTPVAYVGGEFFRGYVLKEKHRVSWEKSMASIAIEKITEAVIWISVIFIGALIFLSSPHAPTISRLLSISILATLFFGGAVALVLIFMFQKKSIIYGFILKPFRLEKSQSGKFIYDVEKDVISFFSRRNRKHLFWVLRMSLLKYVFFWLRNIFLIYFLQGIVSVSGGIMSVGFLQLSYIFPVPAALGAQEGLLSAVFSGVGYEAGFGAAFSFLLRIADIIAVGVGLYFGIRFGVAKFLFRVLKLFKKRIDVKNFE